MLVPGALGFVLAAVTGLGLILLAAKAHGRALRLEREARGFHDVTFADPPFEVAVIWRRDRHRYWTILPISALLILFGARAGIGAWGIAILLALVGAPVIAFGALGIDSFARHPQPRGSRATSMGWWLAVFAGTLAWLVMVIF